MGSLLRWADGDSCWPTGAAQYMASVVVVWDTRGAGDRKEKEGIDNVNSVQARKQPRIVEEEEQSSSMMAASVANLFRALVFLIGRHWQQATSPGQYRKVLVLTFICSSTCLAPASSLRAILPTRENDHAVAV